MRTFSNVEFSTGVIWKFQLLLNTYVTDIENSTMHITHCTSTTLPKIQHSNINFTQRICKSNLENKTLSSFMKSLKPLISIPKYNIIMILPW